MIKLTMFAVCSMLFCNFKLVCFDYLFFFSLCLFNGGCIVKFYPLGPARRFLYDDAG